MRWKGNKKTKKDLHCFSFFFSCPFGRRHVAAADHRQGRPLHHLHHPAAHPQAPGRSRHPSPTQVAFPNSPTVSLSFSLSLSANGHGRCHAAGGGHQKAGCDVHCHTVKIGLDSDVFVPHNTIGMYASWQDMVAACRLFDECLATDVVSWTTMVTGYSNCNELDLAWWFFNRMPEQNPALWNAMIAGYAQADRKAEAWELLDEIPERNTASWSSLVLGYAQCGMCREALEVFHKMVESRVMPNELALWLHGGLAWASRAREGCFGFHGTDVLQAASRAVGSSCRCL